MSLSPPIVNNSARAGRVIPGFHLSLGFTLLYLSLIVLIPLSAVVINTLSMTWEAFWKAVTSPRVVASYQLSFGASLIAALVNLFFGTILAWVLVRYQFFGKKILDAFSAQNLQTDIVLTAMDSDVIQQYVALGMGVGIVASMAIGPNSNQNLKAIPADHLFAPNTTRVAVRRGAYLRAYTLEFILQLAPKLKRAEILAAV
jgi:hypothetical protein